MELLLYGKTAKILYTQYRSQDLFKFCAYQQCKLRYHVRDSGWGFGTKAQEGQIYKM